MLINLFEQYSSHIYVSNKEIKRKVSAFSNFEMKLYAFYTDTDIQS